MEFTPHPYQQRGIDMLTSTLMGVGMGLDPGLGKTSIALAAFNQLYVQYPGIQMLVIVPINPMYGTWPAEMGKWDQFKHLTYSIIHGTPKQRKAALAKSADVYLINPEGIKWLFAQPSDDLPDWKVLCIDESTKFKNSTGKRFKLLKAHLNDFYWRWILTGTLAPNGLGDLYGQAYILDQGAALGKYVTHFRHRYFYQTGFGGYEWTPKEGALEQITAAIEPRILQLKAEDYLDMPDMVQVTRKVKLDKNEYDIYQEMEKEFILELKEQDTTVIAANKGAAGMKCRQIANGAVYGEEQAVAQVHDHKLDELQDIIEETNGHPLLLMYEFGHDRSRIQKYLGDDCVCITGLKGDKLTSVLERFNTGKVKYLLMHPQSAHGMNIQKSCHHIVWFSIPWDLELFIQANTRLYRQGQTAPSVMCYLLTAESTIDEVVARTLSLKTHDQKSIERALRKYCGTK